MSSRPLLSCRVTGGRCLMASHGQNVTLCFSMSARASVWLCMFARVSSTCMRCRTGELRRAETAGRRRHNHWQQQRSSEQGLGIDFLVPCWMCGYFQGGCAGSEVGLTWSDIWFEIKCLSWKWAINTSTLAVNCESLLETSVGASSLHMHCSPHLSSAFLVLNCLPLNELDASLSLLVLLCLCVHGPQIREHFAKTGSSSAGPPGAAPRRCPEWRHGDLPWNLPHHSFTGRKPF